MPVAEAGSPTLDPRLPFGLTGGIACGKSTVAGYFRELGAYIIDADRLGHESIEPGQPGYKEIVDRFGPDILDPAGHIDRKILGPRVFADPQLLRDLDAIVHPRIIARAQELTAARQAQDPKAVIIVDAALVFEAGIGGTMRAVIAAWCRPEQQLERLMAKAGLSREQAERRIKAQMSAEEKRRRADYVIDCSGTREESRAQVRALYPQLRAIAEQSRT